MDNYSSILKKYWGYDSFRGIQREIIESIGAGRDTLGLMPTGGGKSITFQVPALSMEGVCLVITPLLALMKDQVQHLRSYGIIAEAIHSGMSRGDILKALENSILGHVKFLYVSPERLSSPLFLTKLRHINVSFITVDEAHCISQWGYDFRPSYLRIADIRQLLPGKPVLALTATATPEVVDDIQDKLQFAAPCVFRMSFDRKNLSYVVRQTEDKPGQLLHILDMVPGSAIVYTRSRRKTKRISEFLEQHGFSATFFHAGLENSVKDERQRQWYRGEKRIIVATNAFGLGIDKPDVRVVVHVDCPDSIEAYFQEAGRAGRDGQKAYAVLLWNELEWKKLKKRIGYNYPDLEYIRDVYEHLAYYFTIGIGSGAGHTFNFEPDKFCNIYKYFPLCVRSSLQLLSNAGYIYYDNDPDGAARVRFLLGRSELYRLNESTPQEDKVITALLRCYGGLFVGYSYIEEELLAHETGLTRDQCYQVLRSLSQRCIISFIPRRKQPLITYLRDRVAPEQVVLPKEVYEERKSQYESRISSMIAYATSRDMCRSRLLLHYFGEERKDDCGGCDICQGQDMVHHTQDEVRKLIFDLLSDGQKHHVTELKGLSCTLSALEKSLQYLVNEEIVHIDGPFVYIDGPVIHS